MNYRKMLVILMLGALTACQGPAGEAGATGPAGEIGPKGDQGVAGNDGTAGQDLAAPSAAIASVAPNALLVGRPRPFASSVTSPNGTKPRRFVSRYGRCGC